MLAHRLRRRPYIKPTLALKLEALIFSIKTMETKGFHSILNYHKCLSYSSFCFIWIPVLWVYGNYIFFYSYKSIPGRPRWLIRIDWGL